MIGAAQISGLALPNTPLQAETGATVKNVPEARQKDMAKEFEATFLSMLLKEMRQSLEPDGGLFPGDTGDVQGGLFDLYLGKHMADNGGVGLAASILRQMQPTTAAANPVSPSDVTTPRLATPAVTATPPG